MSLPVAEQFNIGCGVDSRSNPLNMPQNRALRMRNYNPKDSGVLELRWGFSTVSMSGSTSTAAFNSLVPYTFYDNSGNQTPFIIMGQGLNLTAMNISTGAVTSPAVRGAALASTASFSSYLSNGKVHIGNGTDKKFFDGTVFRDNGLRQLTTAEFSVVSVYASMPEISAASLSTISLAQTSSGGNFTTQSQGGMLFYLPMFNTGNQELGPSADFVSTGRIQVAAANSKVTLGNLPAEPWIKLVARTDDGAASAYFCLTANPVAIATITSTGSTLTVTTSVNHGRSTGDIVIITGSSVANYNAPWAIVVTGLTTFTVAITFSVGTSAATGGTVAPILNQAAASTASLDVVSSTRDTVFIVNDGNRGIPPSTVGGANPGYQFYAAIANVNGGAHVGNRVAIGTRIVSTVRTNVTIAQLPNLSLTDSEWQAQIGRTGDGALIPYASSDSSGNALYAPSGQTQVGVFNFGNVDGTQELPTRNGIVPAVYNLFARVVDRIYGGQIGRPTIGWSATESDDLTGNFVGRPEQSWAANDIDTFPTAKGLTGLWAEDRGAFYGTKDDGAIFADLGTGMGWLGPWYGAGMAGAKSWCPTPYGTFWVTGHKQLATMVNGSPGSVSDEYQQALLSRIGDSFLSFVEMQHIQDVAKGIDHVLIKCLDSNGNPFEVIHDFRLRDVRSQSGQAYDYSYSAPLSTNFVLAKVRDAGGDERLWAGASTGQIYQLHTGADDAGTQYSGDAIFLLNVGPDRPGIPELRWYGDQNVIWSRGEKMKSSIAPGAQFAFEPITPQSGGMPVDGGQDNFHYRTIAKSSEGLEHVYIRLQLTSHSADGTLALNDPPHVPLENYGRIYMVQALEGQKQGA